MKKIRILKLSFLLIELIIMTACSSDNLDHSVPVTPVQNPIKAVTAIDGNDSTVNGVVDNMGKTISMLFSHKTVEELKSTPLKITFGTRTKRISPTDSIVTVDLTKPYSIIVNNLVEDQTYVLNATVVPLLSVKAKDGDGGMVNAVIDQEKHTVDFTFNKLQPEDLDSIELHIEYSSAAKPITPKDSVVRVNLRNGYTIKVNDMKEDISYAVTAKIISTCPKPYKEFHLDNDGKQQEGNISYLWDNETMQNIGDYGSVKYHNYLTTGSFTVDLGNWYYLKDFTANFYWFLTNVCPKKLQLYGYTKEGTPPTDGNWDDWTPLGSSVDNTDFPEENFAQGDVVSFPYEEAPYCRYVRVRCLENFKATPTQEFSLGEITFTSYKK